MSNILRRGRLSSDPDEEMKNYTSSIEADKWIFEADVFVDLAHTLMLEKQGIIQKDDCKSILRGLLQIRKEGMEKLCLDYEDIHIALEARLIELTHEETGGRMHSGRSRNDEVATCIRFALREEVLGLMHEMMELQKALVALAEKNTETIMPGFTHLQHAQPTTFAHHVLAHAQSLERDIERLKDSYKRINLNPLGSAAFASTGFKLDRDMTTKLLGFSQTIPNSMDAVSSRDFMIEAASVFANIAIHLSRMAEELVVWSSQEFMFVEIDDKYASTSSIMPQKKNPDTAELIRGKTGVVVGSLMALLTICKGLPMSYNRDLQEATPNIQKSVQATRSSVRIMTGIMKTISIRKDVLFDKSTEGFTTATELADTLVRETGMPFRTAHQIIGVLAKIEKKPSLDVLDEISEDILGYRLSDKGLTKEHIRRASDPFENISVRTNMGGPSPETIKKEIQNKLMRLQTYEKEIETLQNNVDESLNRLMEKVNKKIE